MTLVNYLFECENGLFFKMGAEFIGTMMFHFIGSVSPTPWANGIALMILVYFVAKISNGHLNPAVSTVFMLLGYINPIEMIAYWFAQVCGCAVGALWIYALIPDLFLWRQIDSPAALYYSGCFVPKANITNAQIYGWEAVATTCFILPIFSVVWYTLHKPGYGLVGPIMIGLSLIANALAAGPWTGASLNPARTVGSPIVFNCPDNDKIYLYILGEFTAALIAPIVLIPWYGIATTCWYLKYFPANFKKFIKHRQPSLRFSSNENSPA
jgi:glycerol uptake facilitator-like aquaporin